MLNLQEAFALFNDEYLEFKQVENPQSKRPDLHAFLLLDRLVPGTTDIVSATAHDEFYLSVVPDALASVATEDEIRDLVRCGVRYNAEYDSLCMFV